MQYDWIDFYTEFATKLLHFKTDRKTLIQKIYAVYDATGISVPKLESGDEIIDIDPFTIFGTFNKGITMLIESLFLMGLRQNSKFLQRCRAILMEFRFSII